MTIAAADGPAPRAHHRTRPGRPTSVTVTASSGGSVPRSPAAAASCCSRHSPPASPPTAPAAARPRPPGVHTPPDNEHDTEDQSAESTGPSLSARSGIGPPTTSTATTPGTPCRSTRCTSGSATRRTHLPATDLTRRRRQQPRLRPHRLAPPQLARPIRAAQGCAATHGGILLIPNWMAAWRYQGNTEWPGCLPRWAFPTSFVPHRME